MTDSELLDLVDAGKVNLRQIHRADDGTWEVYYPKNRHDPRYIVNGERWVTCQGLRECIEKLAKRK